MANKDGSESVKINGGVISVVRKHKEMTGVSVTRFVEDAILEKVNTLSDDLKDRIGIRSSKKKKKWLHPLATHFCQPTALMLINLVNSLVKKGEDMSDYHRVKKWVVQKASVTNPNKDYWSASVTLGGMDYNGFGSTIEKAYNNLTADIVTSKYKMKQFNKINPPTG
jgi:hypothetical protein